MGLLCKPLHAAYIRLCLCIRHVCNILSRLCCRSCHMLLCQLAVISYRVHDGCRSLMIDTCLVDIKGGPFTASSTHMCSNMHLIHHEQLLRIARRNSNFFTAPGLGGPVGHAIPCWATFKVTFTQHALPLSSAEYWHWQQCHPVGDILMSVYRHRVRCA